MATKKKTNLIPIGHLRCVLDSLPVYMRGHRRKVADTTSVTSHSWVVDGGMVKSIHMLSPVTGQVVRKSICRYLHCNWGSEGQFNGFFLDKVLKPDSNDTVYTAYNNSLKIIHEIYPN